MRTVETLPEGYEEIYSVDLQKDKKMALFINMIAFVIAVALIIPVLFVVPISNLFDMENGLLPYCLRFLALILLTVGYLVLHELVHGIAMKMCGTKKVKYGFTGLYAFAGSTDYYCKKDYIFIALAPIVFWGIVLAIVIPMVSAEWFWVIYFIQVFNISGAAGDLFVTAKFAKFPKDILVRDYGVSMVVYSKE